MLRKPGAYRNPSEEQRATSRLTKDEQAEWFQPIWTGLTGVSAKDHPAPYPVELVYRLVRMFSFTEDTVLDPFSGTGSTTIAAIRADRNSVANEIDRQYFDLAVRRIRQELGQPKMFGEQPSLVTRRSDARTPR